MPHDADRADARPICACNLAKVLQIQAKLRTSVAPPLSGAYRQHVFLTLMVIGLVGLAAMAIPAFGHSHGALSGHGVSHAAHAPGGHGIHASVPSARGALQQLIPADTARESRWRWLPSPRALFSVLALYGAFGNAAEHAFQLSPVWAALAAVAPAGLVERLLVRPLWNVLFRIQAAECSPLGQLVLSEARAVVPFRNGRGLVST